jgi:hypothetical protein
MIQGVVDLFTEEQAQGVASISYVELSAADAAMGNLHTVREGGWLFYVKPGKYVRLHVNKELMMSDTDMERRSNADFIRAAKGTVLIAGLGIGLVLKNMLDKPEVTSVVVIEKYQDVIDLVGPKFNNPKLQIICADIDEWLPAPGTKFDTIYFDIWPDINEDNYKHIKKLHARFRKFKAPDGWLDSWMREFLKKRVYKSNQEARFDRKWHEMFYGSQHLNDIKL